jgi:hypothetical protein
VPGAACKKRNNTQQRAVTEPCVRNTRNNGSLKVGDVATDLMRDCPERSGGGASSMCSRWAYGDIEYRVGTFESCEQDSRVNGNYCQGAYHLQVLLVQEGGVGC